MKTEHPLTETAMPRIPPLPLEQIPADLSAAIAHARATGVLSSTVPVQVWAHRPQVALGWLSALQAFYSDGCLSERLRELVRLKIASITSCQACQIARKSDTVTEDDLACLSWDDTRFDPTEQAAMRYAELFASDYFSIDDAIFDQLRSVFSTEEIVELNMFVALMLAGGRMTYVQRAYETEPPSD